MREIGSILTWTPALEGSTGNPVLTYNTRSGRVIRIGQNLLSMNLQLIVNTGWTAGTGVVRLTPPTIAGGFNPVAGNTIPTMNGMCLLNTAGLIVDKWRFDNSFNIIPCLNNGDDLLWSQLTATGVQITLTFNYLIHI